MSDFKRLRVWRAAHSLVLNTNRIAGGIRGTRYAALRSQMDRAAMSVSANIVEGRQQRTEREFARFLGYSLASVSELENHLIVARDISAISQSDYHSLLVQVTDVRKMLHGLIGKLSKSLQSGRPVPTLAAESNQRSAGSG
jgi:four helix bundle protein